MTRTERHQEEIAAARTAYDAREAETRAAETTAS
ncbi:hypothetical protein HDA41_004809 [Streptomyces caelestis]|uniref:Uncharacterized protein n=1 Tax=Streptomyces caelestis TaxID=36816 RepID=A0A7W9H746_9ACTN|nr:hypothetical protein [Streptomyces caelestis]